MSVPVPPTDDEILMTLDECGLRWVAWQHALSHAGPDDLLALLELELATDQWRERFQALVARRGWVLDAGIADETGPFGSYLLAA